jgi:hypothetical protein
MNEGKSNEQIWLEFTDLFEKNDFFKYFRSHITNNKLGYGENEFCVLWDKIISSLGKDFSFLEIGVYKGQILCLVALLAQKYNLKSSIYGVSPLYNLSDKTTIYDEADYKAEIIGLHQHFNVIFDLDKQIINGLSTDENIKNQVLKMPQFDIVYIDGGHEYGTVVSDIDLAKTICKNNGYIVADDASFFKKFKDFSFFLGHPEVSLAVQDFLENDPNYSEEYCVGHLRVFRKNN